MANELPETLYHYCSLDTFIKIIDTSTIRLYDVCRSNDSMEAKWTTGIFSNYVEKYIRQIKSLEPKLEKSCYFQVDEKKDAFKSLPENKQNELRKISNSLQVSRTRVEMINSQIAEQMKKVIDNYIAISKYLAYGAYLYVWVFCLSVIGDSLGQWRGYGDDGYGISIGFKNDYFIHINDSTPSNEWPYYVGLRKAEYLGELDPILNTLGINKLDDEIKNGDIESITQVIERGFQKAYELIPLFKHPSFAEELEWRIFLMPMMIDFDTAHKMRHFDVVGKLRPSNNDLLDNEVSLGDLQFDARNRKLTSFVPMKIHELGKAINEIIIGPKSSLKEMDIYRLLVQYNVIDKMTSNSIIIRKSDSTYS